jgi:hypothetical protein
VQREVRASAVIRTGFKVAPKRDLNLDMPCAADPRPGKILKKALKTPDVPLDSGLLYGKEVLD